MCGDGSISHWQHRLPSLVNDIISDDEYFIRSLTHPPQSWSLRKFHQSFTMKFITPSCVLTASLIVLSVAALPAVPLDPRASAKEVPQYLDKSGPQIFWRADLAEGIALVQELYPKNGHPGKHTGRKSEFSSVGALYVFDVSIGRCRLFPLTQATTAPRAGNQAWNQYGGGIGEGI